MERGGAGRGVDGSGWFVGLGSLFWNFDRFAALAVLAGFLKRGDGRGCCIARRGGGVKRCVCVCMAPRSAYTGFG